VNRECTRHDRGSVRKFCKSGEVNSPLPDLHYRPFTLVLVTLIGTLSLVRFLGPRTIPNKMIRTPTIETAIIAAFLWDLLHIWPWAGLLWLLRRYRGSIPSLLLGRPENQSAKWGIPLWLSNLCIRNNPIPRWLNTRGSSRSLSFLLNMMCQDTILLG
jgi:hypothetical protein